MATDEQDVDASLFRSQRLGRFHSQCPTRGDDAGEQANAHHECRVGDEQRDLPEREPAVGQDERRRATVNESTA